MIIVPMVLVPLIPGVAAADLPLLVFAGYAAWGMGMLLFVLIASLLYDRLVFHPLPAAPLAPALWIGLGPIGVGSLALLRLARAGAPVWGDRGAGRDRPIVDRSGRALGIRRLVARRRRLSCSAPICAAAGCPTGWVGGRSHSRWVPSRPARSRLHEPGTWASWSRSELCCSLAFLSSGSS